MHTNLNGIRKRALLINYDKDVIMKLNFDKFNDKKIVEKNIIEIIYCTQVFFCIFIYLLLFFMKIE